MKGINIKIVVIVLLLLSVSVLTWAIQNRYFKRPAKEVHKPVSVKFATPVYDQALMKKFEQLGKKYDTLKQNYTIKGLITMIDKADTTNQMKNVDFVLCKKGNALYYKLGATETINEDGLYLYIDHVGKKILIARQKQINANGIQDLTKMAATLKAEYYNVTGSVKNNIQTLSIINEHHITCKQYTVSYDTTDYQINHIYMRLTNFYDPLNKNKEKIIDMSLSEWDNKDHINNYTSPAVIVKKEGSKWIKMSGYENYELIGV